MNAEPRDLDESDVDLWLDLPTERGLRDLVLSLVARHGLVAAERRWHEERWVVRARSLAMSSTGEPLVRCAWQRHADHDLWADAEWPTLPDDVLPPDAPEPGDPSAEARCWLHERPLPECGCPTMGRVLVGTAYERMTGEPQAASPFEREASAVVVERWQSACPSCRAHFVCDERPSHLCAECAKPTLCWRPGVDAEPLVAWTPRPADRVWCGPMDQGTEQEGVLKASAPSETSHHGSTVEPWTYTQAEGPVSGEPAADAPDRAAPVAASPPAPTNASEGATPPAPSPLSLEKGAPSLAPGNYAPDYACGQATLPAHAPMAAGLLGGARAERLRAEATATPAASKAKRHQWQEREGGDVCVNGCGRVRKSKSAKVGPCVGGAA